MSRTTAIEAMAISTGVSGRHPNGRYVIGSTDRGWHCSSLYPEGCGTRMSGASHLELRQYVQPPPHHRRGVCPRLDRCADLPRLHGCIRVTVTDSDWMYDNVGTIPTYVTGAY